ncbi:MAG TPA: hypothetical protein VNQ33_10780 [Acidimicrobiales bacterium]|nr:hypothetical protein [Acidimicrobiales bacterium]
MLLLIVALALVVGSTALVVSSLGFASRVSAVLAGSVIGLAQVNVSVLIAGAVIHELEPFVLLGVTAVVALASAALALAFASDGIGLFADLLERLPFPARGDVGARVLADPQAARPDPSDSGVEGDRRVLGDADADDSAWPRRWITAAWEAVAGHPFHTICLVLVAVAYAWHVFLALALPIVDYDGLALHATAVAHWVTSGGFGRSGLSVTLDSAPLGPAAISAWAATFTGSLRWVFATQLAFTAVGVLAVIDLARRFGASLADAVLAGAVFGAVPVVVLQATSAYADLGASTPLLAAWSFGLGAYASASEKPAFGRDRQASRSHGGAGTGQHLVVAGSALGLAVGARPANLAAVAVFVVLVVFGSVWAGRTSEASAATVARSTAVRVGIVLLPVLVIGSYWYLRNWIEFGSPLYPFSIGPFHGLGSVEELIVAPNRPDTLDAVGGNVARTITSWSADLPPGSYAVDQRLGGFGPLFLVALVPALVLFVSRSVRTAPARAIAVVAPAVLLLALQPAPWWARGTIFIPGIAAAAFAAVLPEQRGGVRTGVLAGATVLLGWGLWAVASQTVYTDAVTHRRVELGDAWSLVHEDDRAHAVLPYSGYAVLDTYPSGTVVAVLDGFVPSQRAPLYGQDLDRRLVIVPPTSDPDELARSMDQAGADIAVVPVSSESLIEAVRQPGSPLQIVAERGASPARTVLVAPA